MSDEQKTEQTTSDNLTIDEVRKEISTVLSKLFESGKADITEHEKNRADVAKNAAKEGETTTISVAEEIRTELERLKSSENEKNWKSGIESEVQRLAGLAEKSPVELGKLTKFLWGDK